MSGSGREVKMDLTAISLRGKMVYRPIFIPFSTPFPPSKIKENKNKKADVFKPFSQKKKSSERMQWAAEGERCSSLFPTPIFFLFRLFAPFFRKDLLKKRKNTRRNRPLKDYWLSFNGLYFISSFWNLGFLLVFL